MSTFLFDATKLLRPSLRYFIFCISLLITALPHPALAEGTVQIQPAGFYLPGSPTWTGATPAAVCVAHPNFCGWAPGTLISSMTCGIVPGSAVYNPSFCISHTEPIVPLSSCPPNSTGTPMPINPTVCTCNAGYQPDSAGTSCVPSQEGLIITLQGGTTTQHSTLLPFNAVVKDQNSVVQSGKQVTITATVQNGTGGHIHTENRPKGNFTCSSSLGTSPATCTLTTDGSGQAPFEFVATPISGTHTITATCTGCSNTATAQVNVKVDGLTPIPAAPKLYALQDSAGAVIGAVAGKHTVNHYLTSTAIGKLNKFATNYQKTNPGAKLYLNDASLVWGGLFDVGSSPWMSPHNGHNRGMSIDIRAANSGVNNEGAVPATAFAKVSKSAADAHAKAALHCSDNGVLRIGAPCNGIPNNRHFHVDF